MEIRTGNDVIGWVTWQVEIPEATRWEILKRDLAQVHAAPEGGVEIVADVTGLVELLEQSSGLHLDSESSVRELPHVHLRDLVGTIAWWLHTGLDPAALRAAGEGAVRPQAVSGMGQGDTAGGGGTAGQRPFEPAGMP